MAEGTHPVGCRVMFIKRLTLSDACTSKQIKLPRSAAETFITPMADRESVKLDVIDEDGQTWSFACTRYNCQYALSKIGSFAVAHNLAPDDNMIFYFDHQNRLCIACRKTLPAVLKNGLVVELPRGGYTSASGHIPLSKRPASPHEHAERSMERQQTKRDNLECSKGQQQIGAFSPARDALKLLTDQHESRSEVSARKKRKQQQDPPLSAASEARNSFEAGGRILDGDVHSMQENIAPPYQSRFRNEHMPQPRDWMGSTPVNGGSSWRQQHRHAIQRHNTQMPFGNLEQPDHTAASPAAPRDAASFPTGNARQRQQQPVNRDGRLLGPSPSPMLSPMRIHSTGARGIAPVMAPPSFLLPGLLGPFGFPSPANVAHQSRPLSSLPAATGSFSVTPSMKAGPSFLQALRIGAISEPRPLQSSWQLQHSPRGMLAPEVPSGHSPHTDLRTWKHQSGAAGPSEKLEVGTNGGSGSSDSEDGLEAAEALTMLATGVRPGPPASMSRTRLGELEGSVAPLDLSLGDDPVQLGSPLASASFDGPLCGQLGRRLDLHTALLSPRTGGGLGSMKRPMSCPEAPRQTSGDGQWGVTWSDSTALESANNRILGEGPSAIHQPEVMASLECLKHLVAPSASPHHVPVRPRQEQQTPSISLASPQHRHWARLGQADAMQQRQGGGLLHDSIPPQSFASAAPPSALAILQAMGRDLTDSIVLCKILTVQDLQQGLVVVSASLLEAKGILLPVAQGRPRPTVNMDMSDERGAIWHCTLQDVPAAGPPESPSGGVGGGGVFCHLVGLSGFMSSMCADVGDMLRVGEGASGQTEGHRVYSVRLLRNADVKRLAETIGRVAAS